MSNMLAKLVDELHVVLIMNKDSNSKGQKWEQTMIIST